MRDAQAALCVGLVDHVFRDFKLADAIAVIYRADKVRVAPGVIGVARIADCDKLDVKDVGVAAKGVGVGGGGGRCQLGTEIGREVVQTIVMFAATRLRLNGVLPNELLR